MPQCHLYALFLGAGWSRQAAGCTWSQRVEFIGVSVPPDTYYVISDTSLSRLSCTDNWKLRSKITLALEIQWNTLKWAVLTVLWIGFCHPGPISLCIDLFVFICVYFVCFCYILHMCCIIVSTVEWNGWDWSLILRTFSALTLLVGSFELTRKTHPRYDL